MDVLGEWPVWRQYGGSLSFLLLVHLFVWLLCVGFTLNYKSGIVAWAQPMSIGHLLVPVIGYDLVCHQTEFNLRQ